jgi:hypothetical protein
LNILSTNDLALLHQQLSDDMPRAILFKIASEPFITMHKLASYMLRRYPANSDAEKYRTMCAKIVRWFINSGDVAEAGNHRLYVLPPYLVEYAKSDQGLDFRLHGDPRIDNILEPEIVPLQWKIVKNKDLISEVQDSDLSSGFGYQRILETNLQQVELVRHSLSVHSLPVLTAEDLIKKLPSVHKLMVPPSIAFQAIPPRWGIWKIYVPEQHNPDRWITLGDRRVGFRGIMKWVPSDDWRGEQSIRYFYSDGTHENLVDLSPVSAVLWMFSMDLLANNPQLVRHQGNSIRVPPTLPAPYVQWLRLASTSRESLVDGDVMQFSLKAPVAASLDLLVRLLGLKAVSGFQV